MNILESVRQSGSKVQVLWTALPLAAALLLPGCPIYLDNGHALSCRVDADCPTGQTCVGGMCQPTVGPTCTTDAMCTANQHCESGACVNGSRPCETHGDCDATFMCDGSACQPSISCTSDASCVGSPAGATGWCDFRNTCVPHDPGDCRTGADCSASQLCIEGTCTDTTSTCQFDHDCPAGTTCVNAVCTAVCTTSSDCAEGDVCSPSHHCTPAVDDCVTSATCATGEHCVSGRCLVDCHGSSSTCPTVARSASYCDPSDSFCHPSWQPHIVCSVDSDCNAGRLCLAHVCRTPCPTMTDSECSAIDSQLPHCQLDTASTHYLCVADGSMTPECRTSADCTSGRECVNASCL